MRSDLMKKGLERAPHRSLFKAMGYTDEEIARPLIGVVNSANEIIPGHIHLGLITQDVQAVMKQISKLGVIDLKAMTVTGNSVGVNLKRAAVLNSDVIRTLDNPYSLEGRRHSHPEREHRPRRRGGQAVRGRREDACQ
jgi:dihydroxy-acid dehydratase